MKSEDVVNFNDIVSDSDIVDKKVSQESIDELKELVEKMEADRLKKIQHAHETLIANLGVKAEKFETISGFMLALNTIRDFTNNKTTDIYVEWATAASVSIHAAAEILKLRDKFTNATLDDFEALVDDFFDHNFCEKFRNGSLKNPSINEIALEAIRLDTCQVVGPACEDIVEFNKRALEEIEKTKERIAELEAEK